MYVCGSNITDKKERVYCSKPSFTNHTKTDMHQRWLQELSSKKMNYFTECQELKQTMHSQKCIIAQYEKDLNTKNKTIDILTEQLLKYTQANPTSIDLLTFD